MIWEEKINGQKENKDESSIEAERKCKIKKENFIDKQTRHMENSIIQIF